MIEVRRLSRDELRARLDEVAGLRLAVFRDWPYLYDGDLDYERAYLSVYLHAPAAIVVGALVEGQLVGASTGLPLEEASGDFSAPFADFPDGMSSVYYAGESVMLPQYRGAGVGRRFFELREAQARAIGRRYMAFCAVERPADHPLRPASHRGNEAFWRRLGYAPVPDRVAEFEWRDLGAAVETVHRLPFWMRSLD